MTTSTLTATSGLTREAAIALSERAGENGALREKRLRSLLAFDSIPMPTQSDRPWRYIDVARLNLDGLQTWAPAARTPLHFEQKLNGYGAVRSNSEISFLVCAEDPGARKGVVLTPLALGAADRPDIVDRFLQGEALPAGHSKFAALNGAFHTGGLLIYVPRDVEVSEPVRIVSYAEADNLLYAPRTLIVAEANSRVSVIEEFLSPDGARIVAAPAVEIYPLDGAQVNYTTVHRWGDETRCVFEQRTPLARDSALESVTVSLGGRLVKGHIDSLMEGDGSRSELMGVFFGMGRQQVDIVTLQDHIGQKTVSDLLMKSALKDRSRSSYYGITRVNKYAFGSDANQENRNVLLSEQAKADSDPVLEIMTPEVVRCAHGATVGPVDEEQLFYLQARGIPVEGAETMLLQGFFNQVIDRIRDQSLREELEALVEDELATSNWAAH
jgi:Fe-S cluster assembly protein SufD